MKPSEHEKLLKEILPQEDSADFRQTSLEGGLTFLRCQRRHRRLLRASMAGAMLCLVAFGIFFTSRHSPHENSFTPQPTVAAQPASTDSHVAFISDDELLALFPGRSVALIGKPGEQRLVFLDPPHNDPAQAPF